MFALKNLIVRFLVRCLADRRPQTKVSSGTLHIVVPRWDAKLGDAIVSSFFFHEAQKLNARVTVLTVAELAPIHAQDFGVNEVIVTDANPSIAQLFKIARQLGKVDVVVHLVNRIRSVEILFLRLLRPAKVYSFDDDLQCVNRKLGIETASLNAPERFERVLLDLGAREVVRKYIVPLPPPSHIANHAPQILINPFASRPDKSLAFDKALRLLCAVADAYPKKAIGILCSPRSLADAKNLEATIARKNVLALDDVNTPQKAAAYINDAQAIISVDTATVHMAVGLETKLVAIYPDIGNEHNPWLPPASINTRVVYSHQDEFEQRRTGKKNMNMFNVEDVVSNLDILMGKNPESTQTISLQACIIPGLGAATETLSRQLPLISQDFPEVSVCHWGTINLKLECPLIVTNPDHRTVPLAWTPSKRTREVFDLLRIELELHISQTRRRVPAWLYIAHSSPHRRTPMIHEVIATPLNLTDVESCRIHLRESAVSLAAV